MRLALSIVFALFVTVIMGCVTTEQMKVVESAEVSSNKIAKILRTDGTIKHVFSQKETPVGAELPPPGHRGYLSEYSDDSLAYRTAAGFTVYRATEQNFRTLIGTFAVPHLKPSAITGAGTAVLGMQLSPTLRAMT